MRKKTLSILAILAILFIASYIGYKKIKERQINEKINYSLSELSKLKIHKLENSTKTVEYKYLLALQLNRWDIALKLLKPLAEKGDPDAMFWYAYISPTNAFSGSDLAKKFSDAADKGNPYAAMQLSKQGEYCSTYLASYCNDKWKDKAINILKNKEKNNEATLLDQYYLHIYQGGDKENIDKNVIDIIYRNAEVGNYEPLVNYIVYVVKNYSLSNGQMDYLRKIIKSLVDIEFIPALNMAYYWPNKFDIEIPYIIKKYANLGGYCSECVRYYKSIKTRDAILKVGSYFLIKNTLNDTKELFKHYKISDIKLEKDIYLLNLYLDDLNLPHLDKKEILKIKKSAANSLNNKYIPIYINQANYSDYN